MKIDVFPHILPKRFFYEGNARRMLRLHLK